MEELRIDMRKQTPEQIQQGVRDAQLCFKLKIGKRVVIMNQIITCKPVVLKRNCWIGAGAVVTKNVEPNTVVGGIPAKLIKRL